MTPDTLGAPAAPFATELRVAVAAAEEAGALLRAHCQRVGSFEVRPKGYGDVVTDLDMLSEKVILGRLQERFPRDRVLSEEAGLLDGDAARTWLVDPLDGSNNVAIGLPACAVGVALSVSGETALGVVHEPLSRATWQATAGRGAIGPGGLLSGPAHPRLPSAPVLAWTQGYAVRDDPVAESMRRRLEARSARLLQLWAPLLAWSMLARGDIDGFVGYRAEGIDLPAGALLAAEAGVELRTLEGAPFRPTFSGPASARSFVAGRPEAVGQLIELLAGAGALAG